MRGQLVAAAVVLAGAAGWAVFQARSSAPDPVRARDNLVREEDLLATFTAPGFREGYRFVLVQDLGWVWERTGEGESPARVVHVDGGPHLLELAPGCFADVGAVQPPLIPGLTVASSLADESPSGDDQTFDYSLTGGDVASFAWAARPDTISVSEDLSSIGDRSYTASTSGLTQSLWYGDYSVRAAHEGDIAGARGLLNTAEASDVTTIVVRERVLGTDLGTAIHGPYTVLIAEDCPDSSVELWPSIAGGQRPGPRASAPTFVIDSATVSAAGVTAVGLPLDAPRVSLLAAADEGQPGTVPLRAGSVFVVRTGEAGAHAVEVVSCLTPELQPCH